MIDLPKEFIGNGSTITVRGRARRAITFGLWVRSLYYLYYPPVYSDFSSRDFSDVFRKTQSR
ncbi:hypothetical protein [Nostoc sp. MG11]|uniref:hypothetical protein n=1 Tax=Nostoc sp. MG11 TaxID=2721166 RepID=UPI001D01981D|nr:hypothetical protein [Nostoc sp. MG11]